jgi:outer membrane receptor protein involved in Fe transport
MIRKRALPILAWLVVASATGLAAQTQAEREKKPLPLDELVVSVTRTELTVRDVPANVTVLTREQIRLSAAHTLPELLRSIPGFTTRDYQSSVAVSLARQAPAMRGLGGTTASRALVLVDGIPLDDPFNGWVYWARIPLELVERVEIVRGGSAGIWGSRALGGVINIITQRPVAEAMRFSLQGGEWSTGRVNGAVMQRRGKLGVAVAGEYFDTKGYHVLPRAARGSIDIPSGSQHEMLFSRLEYEVSPRLGIQLAGSWFDEHRRNATQLKRTGTTVGQLQGGIRYSTQGGSHWSLSGFGARKTGFVFSTTEAADRNSETPAFDWFDLPATSAGANLQWSRQLFSHNDVTVGADVFWADGQVDENTRYIATAFTRVRRTAGQQLQRGLYVQDVLKWADAWTLVASGRLDFARSDDGARVERDIASGNVLVDSAFAPHSESRFTYNIGLRHTLSTRLSWRTSVHTGFRAPTLNEMYKAARESGNATIESNPELAAERLLGTELGVDYAVGSAVVVRATGFWSRLTNPIIDMTIGFAEGGPRNIPPCGTITAGGTCRQRRNLGASRSYGAETELEFQPHPGWRLMGGYTWNRTEVTKAPGQEQLIGKSTRAVPEHSLTARAEYAHPMFGHTALTGRWVGRRYDDDLNTLQLDPFFVLDARLTRRIAAHWEAFGGVENLLGEEYAVTRTTDGSVRIGAPRLVQVGVRANW